MALVKVGAKPQHYTVLQPYS